MYIQAFDKNCILTYSNAQWEFNISSCLLDPDLKKNGLFYAGKWKGKRWERVNKSKI